MWESDPSYLQDRVEWEGEEQDPGYLKDGGEWKGEEQDPSYLKDRVEWEGEEQDNAAQGAVLEDAVVYVTVVSMSVERVMHLS